MDRHQILDGLVQVYRRTGSRVWHCSASIKGTRYRSTTGQEEYAGATKYAHDWYFKLVAGEVAGTLKKPSEKTFRQAAAVFLEDYKASVEGQRSAAWVKGHEGRLRLHLLPFFGDMPLQQINSGRADDYRTHRAQQKIVRPHPTEKGKTIEKSPALSTIHDEIVTLRMVLKCAFRREWIAHIPDVSPAYRANGKVTARPWFSPAEYKQLYEATREHAKNPPLERFRWNAEQIHDYCLFMANTGLRPDEACERNLLHRDVSIIMDDETGEEILLIEVRGKRGVGYCKSMPAAVLPYKRLLNRPKDDWQSKHERARRSRREGGEVPTAQPRFPQPLDPLFPGNHLKIFNNVLKRAGLKFDREGNARTAYSLRHTYISTRLLNGANIYEIAKNCRTSVLMIHKFYASHIANFISAAAVNVRKPRATVKPKETSPAGRKDEGDLAA